MAEATHKQLAVLSEMTDRQLQHMVDLKIVRPTPETADLPRGQKKLYGETDIAISVVIGRLVALNVRTDFIGQVAGFIRERWSEITIEVWEVWRSIHLRVALSKDEVFCNLVRSVDVDDEPYIPTAIELPRADGTTFRVQSSTFICVLDFDLRTPLHRAFYPETYFNHPHSTSEVSDA